LRGLRKVDVLVNPPLTLYFFTDWQSVTKKPGFPLNDKMSFLRFGKCRQAYFFLKGLRHYWQRKSLPTHFFAYLDLLHYYINYVLLFIYHKIVVYQFLRFSAMRRMRFPYRSHITIRERYGSHIGVLLEKFRDLFGNNLYSIYRWLAEY